MVSGASRCGHRGNFGAADRNGAEPSAHQIDTSVRGNETTSSLRHDDHSLQVKEDDPHLTRCALGDNIARASGRYPSRGPSMSLELRRSPSATVVDLALVSICSRMLGTNVKSKTALESHIFHWFFGFHIRR
jgi:hypothetical protein